MDFLSNVPLVKTIWNWIQSRLGLNREHDLAIFKKLNAIADEPRIDKILNSSIYTSYFHIEEHHVLQDFIDALHRIENEYLQSVVRLRAEELAWEMERLLTHVRATFWKVPAGHLKFRPDPIAHEVYEAEWKELNERLEKTWSAYKAYRSTVKTRLRV
jgi:hypothetical protein